MTQNEQTLAVELKSVVKKFGEVTAVNRVNLNIQDGEIFSLLGPSGCGKTTLLRLVAGFETPDDGEVVIQGQTMNRIPPYKRPCNLVFQQLALFPHMSVAANVAFGLQEHKVPKSEIKPRVEEILAVVNLGGLGDRMPHQLSGGQKQRVALARSLVLKPRVLLLDEPLAALDRKLRKEMQTELRRIQREVGTTFLYVTHDQKVALSLSDRIGIMNGGRVVQVGRPADVYENPRTAFVASFMGAGNIFQGKVLSQNGDGVALEISRGVTLKAGECRIAEGEDITGVCVHPEVINVCSHDETSDDPSTNLIDGRVREVFYQGDFTELTVSLEESDQVVSVFISRGSVPGMDFSQGKPVKLRWDACHSKVLFDN